MSMNETTQPTPAPAIRLIFEYDGDQVRLVSQHPVNMAVTAAPPQQSQQVPPPGYYVDTRDAAGAPLSRVMAHNAFSGSAEVFPEHHADPISRVDVARPKGAFTVVVPAPTGADHVSVVRVAPPGTSSQVPGTQAAGPVPGQPVVTEIARFPLHINP